jgi:hypothetical protein
LYKYRKNAFERCLIYHCFNGWSDGDGSTLRQPKLTPTVPLLNFSLARISSTFSVITKLTLLHLFQTELFVDHIFLANKQLVITTSSSVEHYGEPNLLALSVFVAIN